MVAWECMYVEMYACASVVGAKSLRRSWLNGKMCRTVARASPWGVTHAAPSHMYQKSNGALSDTVSRGLL